MTTDDQTEDQEQPSALRARLEQEAQARIAAEAELAQLRSKEMFRDAGLDPTKPLHQAVIRGYSGELTSEAVTAYVSELGVTEPAPAQQAEPAVPVSQNEQDALVRIAEAARDASPAQAPDRREQLRREMEAAARRGNLSEMDRLSEEFSRAGGFRVKQDIPGMT